MTRLLDIENRTEDLPRHNRFTYPTRNVSNIETLVIHHSGTLTGDVRSIANYHINERNWPGIAYHFVIFKDGSIFQTNYLTTISYHAASINSTSIGICLIGNCDINEPTVHQLDTLYRLVSYLCKILQIKSVQPHNKTKNTICPGQFLVNYTNLVLTKLIHHKTLKQ